MGGPMRGVISKVLELSLIEWLILVMILAIVIALTLPGPQWASSGTIEMPVRIVVFDAKTTLPISDADVAIFRAPPATGNFDLAEYRDPIANTLAAMERDDLGKKTDSNGSATIVFEFRTGASHVHTESRAHTSWYWVIVSADGYGSAVLPLRYETLPTKVLREQEFLPAYVGLIRQQ
jgi:hypothetical protein